MNIKLENVALMLLLAVTCLGRDKSVPPPTEKLPPWETFIIEPVKLNSASFWVAADKIGPEINRACRPRTGNEYSCILPVSINHDKQPRCPAPMARLLAEFTWPYHRENLPLTIFNGWQWEYSFNLSQYETAAYNLPARGGSWENCLEVILNATSGDLYESRLQIEDSAKIVYDPNSSKSVSHIEINTFSSLRTRHGYPKKRILRD